MGFRNLLYRINMTVDSVLQAELSVKQRVHIILVVAHYFAENHVLKAIY
jgi:hypothetical protein